MHKKYLQGAGGVEDEGVGDGVELSDSESWVSPDAPDPLPEPDSPFPTKLLKTEQFTSEHK